MLVLLSAGVAADTGRLNSAIADLYVEAALDSRGTGDAAHALNLAETALVYDPASSDALYLRAVFLRVDQERTQEVLADLSSALVLNTYRSVSPSRAAIEYARALHRTRRSQDALLVLGDLNRDTPGFDLEFLADVHHLEAIAARAIGLHGQADLALEAGRRRFPDDPRFLFLELQREPEPSFRYRREIDRLLGEGVESPDMGEVLLRYALTAPVESERLWASRRYVDMGGDDPAVLLAAPGLQGSAAVRQQFLQLDGLARRDVLLDLLDLELPELTEELLASAAEFTGVSRTDRDGDGFWEERVTLSGGAVTLWEVDRDQDGVIELALSFSGGEPDALQVSQNGGVRARYERYPWVRAVTVTEAGGTLEYIAEPFSLQIPVVAAVPFGGPVLSSPLEVARGFTGVDLRAALRAAARVLVRDHSGLVREERFLERGMTVRTRHDTTGDGMFDHLVVYRTGLPASALRDIDADGYYEVAEAYENGRISAVIVDEDDNGVPDVIEYGTGDGIREWDLDQDGTIDVREFGIWTDSVRLQFPFVENAE